MRVDQHYFITCENDAELRDVTRSLKERNIYAEFYPIGKNDSGEQITLVEVFGGMAKPFTVDAVKEELGLE